MAAAAVLASPAPSFAPPFLSLHLDDDACTGSDDLFPDEMGGSPTELFGGVPWLRPVSRPDAPMAADDDDHQDDQDDDHHSGEDEPMSVSSQVSIAPLLGSQQQQQSSEEVRDSLSLLHRLASSCRSAR